MSLKTELNLGFLTITVGQILALLLIIAVGVIISKIILAVFDRTVKKTDKGEHVAAFVRPIIKFVLGIVVALIILDYLNVSLTPFVTILSVVGVALSLSLQDLLSNIFGGMSVIASHPFKVGDFVEIGDFSGKCRSISTVYTELLTIDNKQVYIPNKTVATASIVNYTAHSKRMVEVKIGVSYSSDEGKVREGISAAIASVSAALTDPAPVIVVNDYLNSSVEFLARFWVPTPDYFLSRAEFLSAVRREFDARGVEIPFDQLDVHIVGSGN